MRLVIYSILFFSISNFSLGQNAIHQKVLKDIRKCIHYREAGLYKKIDIYKTLSEIENFFIQEKVLKDRTKESYSKALQNVSVNPDSSYYKNLALKLYKLVKNSEWLEAPAVFTAPVRCNYFILQKDGLSKNSFYEYYYKASLNFDKNGEIDNMQINNRLLYTTPEFDKIEFRSPLIILLYMKINAFRYIRLK